LSYILETAIVCSTNMRIYADTSVFGGVFDTEFSEPSRQFFSEIDAGRFIPKYNAVNTLNGYGQIGIYSPLEVIDYGKDDA